MLACPRPERHRSQQPGGGNRPHVHPQVSDDRTWSPHTTTTLRPEEEGDPTPVQPGPPERAGSWGRAGREAAFQGHRVSVWGVC